MPSGVTGGQRRAGLWTDWRVNQNGYVVRSRWINGRYETQHQHRVILEEILGRKLLRHENVHHLNGVKDDNRPENLELWSTRQPAGQRVEDKVAWAIEVLALYDESSLMKLRALRSGL